MYIKYRSKRKIHRRGMALVAIMLVIFGIMTISLLGVLSSGTQRSNGSLGNGLQSATNSSTQMANARAQYGTAFNMAQSGIEYTLQWLNSLPSPPTGSAGFTPAYTWYHSTASGTLRTPVCPDPVHPGNSFQVVIYPDSANNPVGMVTTNPTSSYLIESIGNCGSQKIILQAYIRTDSLSEYLVLVNSWESNNYWVAGLSSFDGPVHDNNFSGDGSGLPNGALENVNWYDSAGSKAQGWVDAQGNAVPHPLFTYNGNNAYTSSGSGVNWYRDTNIGSTSSPGSGEWNYVASFGQNGIAANTAVVPFPTTSGNQGDAALGLPAGQALPTIPTGVNVTNTGGVASGGIAIGGNVDQMTLSTDSVDKSKQIIEVYQKDSSTGLEDYTKITLNEVGNTTIVQKGTAPAGSLTNTSVTMLPAAQQPSAITGLPNGVVYVKGNVGKQGDPKVGGLSGTIADNVVTSGVITHSNSLTVATDSGDNANIDGNIVYNTTRAKDASGNLLPESSDSNFTLHAGTLGMVSNNILITEKLANGTTMGDVETDGSYMAYTLMDVDHFDSRPVFNWENMGGYLSSSVGYFGVFNPGNGQMVDGALNQFNYDARLLNQPPPYFPSTGNTYHVISWESVSQTLDGVITA